MNNECLVQIEFKRRRYMTGVDNAWMQSNGTRTIVASYVGEGNSSLSFSLSLKWFEYD